MFAKIINQETKEVQVGFGTNIAFYKSLGMTEMDVEQGYNKLWYVKGYAPEKPQSIKEQEVRAVRQRYFEEYVDFYQAKPLYWEELSEEDKYYISSYRVYLKDYTLEENWWEHNPMTIDEWKKHQESGDL